MSDILIDKRIIKTKNSLKKALIELLKTQNIASISIVDITRVANVNRKTFYLHYPNVHSILNEIVNNLLNKLYESIKKYDFTFATTKTFVYNIFNTIYHNEYIVDILRFTTQSQEVLNILEKNVIEALKRKARFHKDIIDIVEFNTYGAFRMFYNLIKQDMTQEKLDDFITLASSIINNVIKNK